MTMFDLRLAFARHYFRMPAGEDGSAPGEDEGQDDNDDNDNDDQDVDNPRLKQLSDEAAKYRRKMKEWRQRAEEAEAKAGDTVRTLRLELAFERLATRAKITDIEAAWRLVEDDLKAVKVEDDQVDAERMQQIVDHVVERYPYLRDDYASQKEEGEGDPPSSPSGTSTNAASGRPVNGRRRSDAGADFGALARKFPALRR